MTEYNYNDKREKEDKKETNNENSPYLFYEQTLVRRIFHFYLSTIIQEPQKYIDMIHRIHIAGPDDIIHIHLNTIGGMLNTGVQIINAMQSSKAHTIVSIEADCYSLGTLIFLAADEYVVHDNCLIMLHNFSGGVSGKGHEQFAQLEATQLWFTSLAKKLYIPFISSEEFERILKGEDVWLHAEEIRERLSNMVQLLESNQNKKIPPTKKPKRGRPKTKR
jgi:ATP-dependent protease ClpP protease subunit